MKAHIDTKALPEIVHMLGQGAIAGVTIHYQNTLNTMALEALANIKGLGNKSI